MTRLHPIRLTALAAAMTLLHLGVQAQTTQARWTLAEIPTLGGSYSTANAINNAGQVTGSAALADGLIHAYRYGAGLMQDLQPFPLVNGVGNAINASGAVAGTSSTTDASLFRGFVVQADNSVYNLGTLGGQNSWATGINDSGQIAGHAEIADGTPHAFLSSNGGMVLARIDGAAYGSRSAGINARGQVVGSRLYSIFTPVPFRYDSSPPTFSELNFGEEVEEVRAINAYGQMTGWQMDQAAGAPVRAYLAVPHENVTVLGSLGGRDSWGYALNTAGQVVGASTTQDEAAIHAFVYSNGSMADLNSFAGIAGTGWTLERANGINDNGQIVGNGVNPLGERRGFIVTLDTTVWTGDEGGSWAAAAHWSHGIAPNRNTSVIIDPGRSITITGPQVATQLKSLLVGGNAGVATLSLAGGVLEVLGQSDLFTRINPKGVLAGDGTITGLVTNLGRVDATNVMLVDGLQNHGAVTGNGILATALTNTATGTLQLGAGQSLLLTGLSHSNAGLVQLTDGAQLRVAGSFSNDAGGEIFVRASSVRFDDVVGNNAGGRIQLNNALVRFDGGLANSGQLLINNGGAEVFGTISTLAGGKIIASGASQSTFYDAIEVQAGGELRVSTGSRAVFFGAVQQRTGALFSGNGTKQYEGGLSIGNSPGLGQDGGDVEFGAGNLYLAEIGGTTRGTQYDAYDVAGSLTFGGTLKLVSWNGFTGQAGQRYDLFDWGTASGQFDSIDASGFLLAGGTLLDTSQLYIDGSVGVLAAAVPEPGTWALLLGGLGLLGHATQRRRTQPPATSPTDAD